jgi:arabinan endo-1,5-alpha-L-arabinosidase
MKHAMADIHMRDPFVFPDARTGTYFLFGTTDPDPWRGPGIGFDVYTSADLESWDGPFPAFRPDAGFWADRNFWAPEVHEYRGGCFMFASFKRDGARRATQILGAESPRGPYRVHSPSPVTPADWECLDGTLHVDSAGLPWLVFCHEWVQVRDGQVCAVRLSEDLRFPVGVPRLLFTASSAPWTIPHRKKDGSIDAAERVTDGPFLHRTASGTLLLLWSSFSETGYSMGIARSESGSLEGPWRHLDSPLLSGDCGHGMVFRDFSSRLLASAHAPNRTPEERPVFVEVEEREGILVRKSG